jgi:hypothetical protein
MADSNSSRTTEMYAAAAAIELFIVSVRLTAAI